MRNLCCPVSRKMSNLTHLVGRRVGGRSYDKNLRRVGCRCTPGRDQLKASGADLYVESASSLSRISALSDSLVLAACHARVRFFLR